LAAVFSGERGRKFVSAVELREELPFSCLNHGAGAMARSSSIANSSPFLAAKNGELITTTAEIVLLFRRSFTV
jgi:hypothetical protein